MPKNSIAEPLHVHTHSAMLWLGGDAYMLALSGLICFNANGTLMCLYLFFLVSTGLWFLQTLAFCNNHLLLSFHVSYGHTLTRVDHFVSRISGITTMGTRRWWHLLILWKLRQNCCKTPWILTQASRPLSDLHIFSLMLW